MWLFSLAHNALEKTFMLIPFMLGTGIALNLNERSDLAWFITWPYVTIVGIAAFSIGCIPYIIYTTIVRWENRFYD